MQRNALTSFNKFNSFDYENEESIFYYNYWLFISIINEIKLIRSNISQMYFKIIF